ncbi:DUF4145 domain-containing protein [Ferruginibacter sp. SUN002]|uniref:DUF4145 domain-containing protein n=1 Tax=Ferruginibacter sp. SUN002 TaxID=2937789 RepID=UPI003D35C445
MELNIWTKRHFTADSKIEWPCPNCNNKTLEIVKTKFHEEETAASKKYRKENEDWEPEWIDLVFSGQLTCNDIIFFTGTGSPEHSGYYDYKADSYNEGWTNTFTPSFFQPSIPIFKIPDNCSKELTAEIRHSFKLFWCDLPSCANRIRVALEILMNEQGVKKYEIKNGKRIPINLHKRIEQYNHPEIKDLLLAIKWIGNSGSHNGTLETIDIVEAFRLLEFSLNKLYNDETKELKKITKEIIKRKGARKAKKK